MSGRHESSKRLGKTKVINKRFAADDVYIGRAATTGGGYFGNPYIMTHESMREHVIDQYREYFNSRITTDPEFARRVLDLRGKRLGCYCKPRPCHGDVIVDWIAKAVCMGCGRQAKTAYSSNGRMILVCQTHCKISLDKEMKE
jgi:hypothetical protein